MIQPLHSHYLFVIASVLAVAQLSASGEEETGSSAVPYLEGKAKPPTPKPIAPRPSKPAPGVKSIGRVGTLTSGVIYAINDNNELMWYRHDGRGDGTFKWADNAGRKVGQGWNVKEVFSE